MHRAVLVLLLLVTCVGTAWSQALDQTYLNYYNPLLSGPTCTSATLQAAITTIGTVQKTLYLTATDRNKVACVWNFDSSITVPANIRLFVPFGVTATIAAGVTLQVQGCLDADDPTWWSGPGQLIETGSCAVDSGDIFGSNWFSYTSENCLHSTAAGSTATVNSCTAFILNTSDALNPKLTRVQTTTPTAIPYSAGDGRYWLLGRLSAATAPVGWTCIGTTMYCTLKSDSEPEVPQNTLLLMRSDVVAGVLTAANDASTRLFNRPVTYNFPHTTAEHSTWIFTPTGSLTYTGQQITHNGSTVAVGMQYIFRSGGTGKLRFGPKTVSDPVWFAGGGSGTHTNPWTSADNCGGLCEAFAALQFEGSLRATRGTYLFASTTPASIDVPVDSANGNITLEFTGAVIRTTSDGTIIKLNKNGVLSDVSTNLNTVRISGGLFTTQPPDVFLQNDAPILGVGIDCNRTRIITITGIRFFGLRKAILANMADTLVIKENVFRRTKDAIFFENNAAVDVPQDMYITHNTGSVTDNVGATTLQGSVFVNIENRVDHLVISNNSIANAVENSRFIRLMTGDETGDSSNITIDGNVTEQYPTGSKLVEVTRFGSTVLQNLVINKNVWSGPQGPIVPPLANGQPALDLNYISGHLDIRNNTFTNNAVTAIRLDNFRGMTLNKPPASSGMIENNTFEQIKENNGYAFNITNVLTPGTILTIGRNSIITFTNASFPNIVYPDTGVQFDTAASPTANMVAAAQMDISPWDDYIEINGTTIITDIKPTWHGHSPCFMFETVSGGMDRSATLLLDNPLRSRIPNESVICIKYDGNLNVWRETGRTTHLTFFDFVAAPVATINGAAELVNVTGSGTVNTITVNRSGQRVTLQCQTITGVVFTDSTPPYTGGNLNLSGPFTCDAVGKTLTIIPNNAVWFESGRSAP